MNKENSNQVRLGKHFFTDFINRDDNNFNQNNNKWKKKK